MKRLLKVTIAIALSLAISYAQGTLSPVNTTTPPIGGYLPGSIIPITIVKTTVPNATNPGNAVTALQFNIQSMTGVATINWVIAPALAANKALSCSLLQNATNSCLIAGFNQALIPDGPIATANVTLVSKISNPNVTFSLFTPVVESDLNGNALTVSLVNPTVSLSVKSSCDVNGDGVIDINDYNAVITQIIAQKTTSATDLNADGVTNAQDAQIVATAGSGGPCNTK